jgi:hypothetical protein
MILIALALIAWLVYRAHQRRVVARRLAILRTVIEIIQRERSSYPG